MQATNETIEMTMCRRLSLPSIITGGCRRRVDQTSGGARAPSNLWRKARRLCPRSCEQPGELWLVSSGSAPMVADDVTTSGFYGNDPMKYIHAILVLSLLSSAALAAEIHVSVNGNNDNDGSINKPLKTISAAAGMAKPGDVITVHAGVYRETVAPPRGGTSAEKPIVYQAAPGEKVEIKGSEVVKNWAKVQGDVWKATVPIPSSAVSIPTAI